MPNININITATQEDVDAIQEWFPDWNAKLNTPYSNLTEALEDALSHQVAAFASSAKQHKSARVQELYDAADPMLQDTIWGLLNPQTP